MSASTGKYLGAVEARQHRLRQRIEVVLPDVQRAEQGDFLSPLLSLLKTVWKVVRARRRWRSGAANKGCS